MATAETPFTLLPRGRPRLGTEIKDKLTKEQYDERKREYRRDYYQRKKLAIQSLQTQLTSTEISEAKTITVPFLIIDGIQVPISATAVISFPPKITVLPKER